jgi:hypothetical protein
MSDESPKFIVVIGNPVDGLEFIEPFREHENAQMFAEDNVEREIDWWICELRQPTTKYGDVVVEKEDEDEEDEAVSNG